MRRLAAAAGLLLLTALPAAAHHGWSGYDSSKLVTLEGTVQEISYSNPHVHLILSADGKTWEIVLAPPSRMQRRGLPEGSIQVEQAVAVEGYLHREDPDEFRAERIRVNGETYELR